MILTTSSAPSHPDDLTMYLKSRLFHFPIQRRLADLLFEACWNLSKNHPSHSGFYLNTYCLESGGNGAGTDTALPDRNQVSLKIDLMRVIFTQISSESVKKANVDRGPSIGSVSLIIRHKLIGRYRIVRPRTHHENQEQSSLVTARLFSLHLF